MDDLISRRAAIALIEENQIGYGPDGPYLGRRFEGNREGLAYAVALRALPSVSVPDAQPVAWTGSGSLMALKDGREGFIWPNSADAHPIPLYARGQGADTAWKPTGVGGCRSCRGEGGFDDTTYDRTGAWTFCNRCGGTGLSDEGFRDFVKEAKARLLDAIETGGQT